MNIGKVYLVGAGPGDPELITVKGKRILETADAVLYDFLSPVELLDLVPPTCEKICVGKRKGFSVKTQDEINALLAEKARQHQTVVRLKGGTPFLFGRGFEELQFLLRNNIECEVIPGVSAAIAAPESFGLPLTVSKQASSVAFCSGHWQNEADIPAPNADLIGYFMSLENIPRIVSKLIKSGWRRSTPCVVLSRATMQNAEMVRGVLEDIASKTASAALKPPGLLYVGTILSPVPELGAL